MTAIPAKPHKFGGRGSGYWFDPSVFAQPAAGTLARTRHAQCDLRPGFQSWNMALQKSFHVIPGHDNHQLTFRGEAFNFTESPQLGYAQI